MFNLGFPELLIIGVLALILIGPKQLPEIARALGRFVNELKRSSSTLSAEFRDVREDFHQARSEFQSSLAQAQKLDAEPAVSKDSEKSIEKASEEKDKQAVSQNTDQKQDGNERNSKA